jgi:hypothetical protein
VVKWGGAKFYILAGPFFLARTGVDFWYRLINLRPVFDDCNGGIMFLKLELDARVFLNGCIHLISEMKTSIRPL